tara:strand:- start:82 stop:429 length:348 start_codon:yes stop_codon:yes gene_type:complete
MKNIINTLYNTYGSSINKPQHIKSMLANDITKKKSNNRLFKIEKYLSKSQRDGLHNLHWANDKGTVCDMLVELIDVEHWSEEYWKLYNSLSKYQMCIAIAIIDTSHHRFTPTIEY